MNHRSTLRFGGVTFAYESSGRTIFQNLSVTLEAGWTGIVGANGAGKTTFLLLAAGLLRPTLGSVGTAGPAAYCAQRTDDMPADLPGLGLASDRAACRLRGALGVAADWAERWATLSHGERKRAQLACGLWAEPEILALDEPTNHLDREARDTIGQALATYRGVGLLVSHDRELLDGLCARCLFLGPGGAVLRPGGVSRGLAQQELEEETARRGYNRAREELQRLEAEAARRKTEAASSRRRLSKRGLSSRDHDARAKRDAARLTGKDAVAGRLKRTMDTRVERARARREDLHLPENRKLGITFPGIRSRRDRLLALPAGVLALGGGRTLAHPGLEIAPGDRIAVTGRNGAGKSTLIREIVTSLDLASERVVYLPQEIDAVRAGRLIREVGRLDRHELGEVLSAVSRLGSDPGQVLDTCLPSPGETRKLLLALGLARTPEIIVMDEPTNHLDLPSIRCLEEALANCSCALLLVSHDARFLAALVRRTWRLEPDPERPESFRLVERSGGT